MCKSNKSEVTFHVSIMVNIRHVILKPSPGLGRLRVVGLASHLLRTSLMHGPLLWENLIRRHSLCFISRFDRPFAIYFLLCHNIVGRKGYNFHKICNHRLICLVCISKLGSKFLGVGSIGVTTTFSEVGVGWIVPSYPSRLSSSPLHNFSTLL